MKPSFFKRARFQTKVLVPVIAVMMLLMAVTMFVVNQRLEVQWQKEADEALQTASAVFKSSRISRFSTGPHPAAPW